MTSEHLQKFLGDPFPEMIKFVIDVRRGIVALGGELHSDAEAVLLDRGSNQGDLWGGNLYVEKTGERRIEYTAMINIRPSAGNSSMQVKDPHIQEGMRRILGQLLP
ncbi:MAG: hypothetical protein HYZ73_08450 [Elusimicrobia bacterium]|nr:hypothetical protein [Elusimicrobiota bacterium]